MKNTWSMLRQYGFIVLMSIVLISCGKKEKEAVKEEVKTEAAAASKPFFKLSLAQWSLHKAILPKS